MRFSKLLEEYLNHRDVVRHVFTSTEVGGDRMDQKEYHQKKMEELANLLDRAVVTRE